jgi:hypothetical protein
MASITLPYTVKKNLIRAITQLAIIAKGNTAEKQVVVHNNIIS